MASQSPQRSRKSQQLANVSAANVRREASPSPSIRDRQRYVRTQSMPIVASLNDLADDAHALVQDAAGGAGQGQAPGLISGQSQVPGSTTNTNNPNNSNSNNNNNNPTSVQVGGGGGSLSAGQVPTLGYPRPIIRVPPPQFLSAADKWQMAAAELQGDHELQQSLPPPPAPGTEGVAYAGGAGGVSIPYGRHMKVAAADAAEGARRRRASAEAQSTHRGSPLAYALRKTGTGNTSPGFTSMPSPRSLKNRTPDRSLPVQEEPDEHEQLHEDEHDLDQAGPRTGVSPAPSSDINPTKDLDHDLEGTLVDLGDDNRQEVSGDSTEGSGSHTPRSPSTMLYEQTQAARGIHEVLQPDKTPSATVKLVQQVNSNNSKAFNVSDFQHTLKKIQGSPVRNGLVNGNGNGNANTNANSAYPHPHPYPPLIGTPGYPPPPPPFSRNESRASYPNWIPDFYHNYPDVEEYYDEASYYHQQFMQAPTSSAPSTTSTSLSQNGGTTVRPGAPIPPTPHSQTSAPTPFQTSGHQMNHDNGHDNGHNSNNSNILGDSMNARNLAPPYSPAPGTPYPYPFSHMRRGFVYPPVSRMPSTVYDPSVAQVQEQIRLQMQMYAYNNSNNNNANTNTNGNSNVNGNVNNSNDYTNNYNYNYNGAMTDSTLSPSSTPYPGMGPSYNPFGAFLNQSRAFAARARAQAAAAAAAANMGGGMGFDGGRVTSAASFRSSPSHLPVPLPPLDAYVGRGRLPGSRKRDRDRFARNSGSRGNNGINTNGGGLGVGGGVGGKHVGMGMGVNGVQRVKPPPRVDSTQPRETSPETSSSSGEETAGEKYDVDVNITASGVGREAAGGGGVTAATPMTTTSASVAESQEWTNASGHADEDNGEWVEEDSGGDEMEDLLDLEFHPSYISNPDRRRKKWEQRWDELVNAFQALDRETDTTLLLLAAPSHTNTLHSLSSRSVRRDASLFDGHAMHALKDEFAQIALQRRAARTQRVSLLERFYAASVGGDGGSVGGEEGGEEGTLARAEREEEMRRLLKTTLQSLEALHTLYESREQRWREEEVRMRMERESMDVLLQQAFGAYLKT